MTEISESDVVTKTVIDLRAFADYLRKNGTQITAAQIDHALDLVERHHLNKCLVKRLNVLEFIQELLDDHGVGLNRDHPIGVLVDHLDDPKSYIPIKAEELLAHRRSQLDRDVGLEREARARDLRSPYAEPEEPQS